MYSFSGLPPAPSGFVFSVANLFDISLKHLMHGSRQAGITICILCSKKTAALPEQLAEIIC